MRGIKMLALGCFVLAAGCVDLAEEDRIAREEMASMPDQESWNAELRVSSGGRPSLVMAAAYMARYESRDSSFAVLGPDPAGTDSSQVRVELYDDTGELAAQLSAETLTYFENQRRFVGEGSVQADLARADGARLTSQRLEYSEEDGRFTASGNVLVTSGDGKRLSADEVVWDAALRELRVDGSFRFTTATERIGGVGLVASEDLARYSFSRASGELEVEE